MNKKLLIVTISMLEENQLKKVKYRKGNEGELYSSEFSFPSLAMIEWNISSADDVSIIPIMTKDEKKCSEKNLNRFKEELNELSKEMNINFKIDKEIEIPHNETVEKQIQLFKEISERYIEGSEVYMDLTYGTKITSIGLFSSLIYAEKVKSCSIKSIIYGKYAFNNSGIGEIYDMKSLYELNMIIHSAEFMPKDEIDILINKLWG